MNLKTLYLYLSRFVQIITCLYNVLYMIECIFEIFNKCSDVAQQEQI